MKMLCATFFLVLFYQHAFSQSEKQPVIYENFQVDSLPKLYVNNELVELKTYLRRNISWQNGMIEWEQILCSYVVDETGNIGAIHLHEIPENCNSCITTFVKAITSVPKLRPAYKNGVPVSVLQAMVFRFTIQR